MVTIAKGKHVLAMMGQSGTLSSRQQGHERLQYRRHQIITRSTSEESFPPKFYNKNDLKENHLKLVKKC